MGSGDSGAGAPPTIVVVDDAAEVRTLVRTRLRLTGRVDVVAEAADGHEALERVREHRPDLVLLDVSMPGMDGLEALPLLLEASPETRVVMYSGFQERGLADRARELGASAFLEKSTALDTLADQLLGVLAAARGTGQPSGGPGPSDPPAATAEGERERDVLGEHLERFREVFDDAAIGMATVTLAGQIVRANAALAQLLERPADELVGTPYANVTAGPRSDVDEAIDSLLAARTRAVRIEHDLAGTSAPRRVVATLAPVLDTLQRPLYLFLQVQDITGQRGAEEQLRQSEARFRLLVENIEDAIFMLSPSGIVESWNPGAERINGYRAEEIIGRHFRVLYPPEKQQLRHPEHELEVALLEGHYEEEDWRVRKDGSRFWASVVITPVHDDGRHVGFAKITRDVTVRRQQEEALRQSEERFRLLVGVVRDYAIFMLDPTGHIASWNEGAQRIKGYRAEEIIGQHFRVFYPRELQEARHPEHELELALRDGAYEEEGWRIRKDGSRFWANVVITAVHDREGRHIGFTKVTRDTTERRQMLEERERSASALAAANARLQQAAEDQAHFLAVTAHELRTPVGVLGGTADLLAAHWSELEDEERAELLSGMSASAVRLRRLLTDLLTASRLQARGLDLDLHPVDLRLIVEYAVSGARRTFPDAEVVADVEPGIIVRADADRLGQAVDNLISNALRHGSPPVRVSVRRAGESAEITVTDAGSGVPEEQRSRLFERFASGRRGGGTGLGLFIVRQLARAHDGDAFYRPPGPDGGSGGFVVSVPLLPAGEALGTRRSES